LSVPLNISISDPLNASFGAIQVADNNPDRVYLIVSIIPATKELRLWPQKLTELNGIGAADGTGTVLLHRNTLGDLIGGEWYAFTASPATIRVIEAWNG
jgi:hypothetical protein